MAATIEELVTETLNQLTHRISTRKPQTREEVTDICRDCFGNAFKQLVSEQEKKLFRRKLSVRCHSDRMESSLPELYHYLQSIQATDIPQICLNERIIAQPIAANPVESTTNFAKSLWQKLEGMRQEYQRYYQPFKAIDFIFSTLVNTLLIVAGIAAILTMLLIFLSFSTLSYLVIKIVAGSQYTKQNDDYQRQQDTLQEAEFEATEKVYLDYLKQRLIDMKPDLADELNKMSQENFKRLLISSQAENNTISYEEAEHEYINTVNQMNISSYFPPYGLTKITMVAKALGHAITDPLPAGWTKVPSAIARPFRLLMAPVVLGITILDEGVIISLFFAAMGLVGTGIVLKTGTLALTNLPLYCLDLFRYVNNGNAATTSMEGPRVETGSYGSMSTTLGGDTPSAKSATQPTGEFTPLLLLTKPNVPRLVRGSQENDRTVPQSLDTADKPRYVGA